MDLVDIPTIMSDENKFKKELIKCNHCNEIITGDISGCCLIFPHVDDSQIVICIECVDTIESKLIPVKNPKKKKIKTLKKNNHSLTEPLIKKNKVWR